MNTFKRSLPALAALTCCMPLSLTWAGGFEDGCYWDKDNPGPMAFIADVGTLFVPRDAAIGDVIGTLDRFLWLKQGPGGVNLICHTVHVPDITVNITNNVPAFSGSLPPIGGENSDGKILTTSIPGVGVRIKLGIPYRGPVDNWYLDGPSVVPFSGYMEKNMFFPWMQASMDSYITLVKIGDINPGPQLFDGRELAQAVITKVGKAWSVSLAGTVIQAECSVSNNPVSADPVDLGEWQQSDFTGPGYTTRATPFTLTLNSCISDPANGVTTAHIRLDGVNGSAPVGDPLNGVFSLSTDSTAKGVGIQMLMGDGSTPVGLGVEVPLQAISPAGDTVLPFNARLYQTDAQVQAGQAKGALDFTITYK